MERMVKGGLLMLYGWKGKILRVDLAKKKFTKEDLPEEWGEKFIGCRGINALILYNEVGPEVDPFSPDNKLIFGTGPLEGTPIGMGRVSIQTKHPKRLIAEGGSGGHWGPALKFAGYDFIIIEKKSETPVYLFIQDDNIEIRDAKNLWGKDTEETYRIIRDKTGIPEIQVASIGPGGERLVADAKIVFTIGHTGGRGCGTIMGDKKLKAIAVHGTGGVSIKDPLKFLEAYRRIRKLLNLRDTIDAFTPPWSFMGATVLLQLFNEQGWLQAYNAQRGRMESFLIGEEYISKYVTRPETGFCCPFPACGRRFEVKDGKYSGISGDEREVGFAMSAANVGINSWPTVLKFRVLCNQAGLDEFQVMFTISWAMECFEKGIINKVDTGGIDLRFGNEEAFIKMTEKIILREGLGDILAKGSEEAAKIIGKGSEKYLLTIKGREIEGMPQRSCYQIALALSVCENGPDHTRWYPPYPPNPKALPKGLSLPFDPIKAFEARNIEDKGRLVKWLFDSRAVLESLPTCVFIIRNILGIDMKPWLEIYNACTGKSHTLEEFIKIGERIVNLERAYIVREGFRRKDDRVPRRMLEEALIDPYVPPIGKNLDMMLDDYYKLRGWDINSAIQNEEKLKELELDFVSEDLKKYRIRG
jgi:aldehyde:ferredoxin oxidoreductase